MTPRCVWPSAGPRGIKVSQIQTCCLFPDPETDPDTFCTSGRHVHRIDAPEILAHFTRPGHEDSFLWSPCPLPSLTVVKLIRQHRLELCQPT